MGQVALTAVVDVYGYGSDISWALAQVWLRNGGVGGEVWGGELGVKGGKEKEGKGERGRGKGEEQ